MKVLSQQDSCTNLYDRIRKSTRLASQRATTLVSCCSSDPAPVPVDDPAPVPVDGPAPVPVANLAHLASDTSPNPDDMTLLKMMRENLRNNRDFAKHLTVLERITATSAASPPAPLPVLSPLCRCSSSAKRNSASASAYVPN